MFKNKPSILYEDIIFKNQFGDIRNVIKIIRGISEHNVIFVLVPWYKSENIAGVYLNLFKSKLLSDLSDVIRISMVYLNKINSLRAP